MASGDTKTEHLLDVLANGSRADIPADNCCNTKTQNYILGAVNRMVSLEEEVEELQNNPDVTDIVSTYQDLTNYDKTTLTDGDVIRVLTDSTHDDESAYYRYNASTDSFDYIGTTRAYTDFIGTSGGMAGASGLVPAPQATDADKYLKSDGTWATVSGGGGGTTNYNSVVNKPKINNVTLQGNKTLSDLGIQPAGNYLTTETDPVFSASPSAGITSSDITSWDNKQAALVSGTNIKTINNQSILGSGNIDIQGGGGGTIIISDTTWTLGTSISNSGALETKKPTFATTDYLEVSAGDVISYTGQVKDGDNVDFRACVMFYNSGKKAIGTRQDLLNTQVITDQPAANDGYIRLMFGRASGTAITLTQNDIDTYCEITQTTSGGGGSIIVVQSTGQSATSVMSQKAVTDALGAGTGVIKKFTPLCDYISVPNEVVGADHWQAIVKVGGEIWFMQQSSAVGGTVNGIIDRVSATDFSYIGKFNHNLGHFNCCEYDEQTDMLITGWASDNTSDPKKLLVFRNVLSWTGLPTGSELNYSSVDVTEVNMSSYLSTLTGRSTILGNAIWADRTTDGHRYAIVSVGNPTETFIKIMLGYGTDQRTYGTYTAAASGVPNGTFSVSWVKTITMPYVQGCTGVKTMINQDAKYYKGGILMALSAIPVTAMYLYEQNETDVLAFDLIRTPWANDNGVTQTGWNQGVLVMDDDIYIGIAPTTTGSTNPNKLAKFKF